ncbi:MAG: Hcp1 family type secretion system effector [Chloroflexi bacterium]|nr:Hcp1 family type secretion system effector [Chloroflexota bacterium]
MAFDAFLKLMNAANQVVAGESQDATHRNEIELSGYNLGAVHPVTQSSATGGAGAGKATFNDFSFTIAASRVSPILFQACAQGTRFNQAIVTLRKSAGGSKTGTGLEFLKITMGSVLVSHFSTGGSSGDDVPHDDVHLSYGKIQIQYTPQRTDGSADVPVSGGWDVQKNGPA